jgi:Acetyl-CoA dehydrogenase C-terminal like
MQSGAGLAAIATEILATLTKAGPSKNSVVKQGANTLGALLARIEPTLKTLYSAPDLNVTLANATVFLEAFGHIVVAWVWLEQAICASAHTDEKDNDFYLGKLQAASYFFRWELPKVDTMLDLLNTLDDTTLTMKDSWF